MRDAEALARAIRQKNNTALGVAGIRSEASACREKLLGDLKALEGSEKVKGELSYYPRGGKGCWLINCLFISQFQLRSLTSSIGNSV